MAKAVNIGYLKNGELQSVHLSNATGVKESEETNTSTVTTFDGIITQGSNENAFTVEISRVSYEKKATYLQIRDTINTLRQTPGIVTVAEDVYPKGEKPFRIVRNYKNAIVDGKDYEIKPEEHTVYNMKFKAGAMTETVKDL